MINEVELIESKAIVKAKHKASELSKEEFTLSRKDTFGGSDASILLGVNLYKDTDALLKEKSIKTITDDEIRVGELPQVRKGSDLEPFILSKAQDILKDWTLFKPEYTYVFIDFSFITVNYDGVILHKTEDILAPVEAKLVTKAGERYYKKEISIEEQKEIDMKRESDDIATHIKLKANKFGIPPYYYTQVQREIAGLNAPFGYLMAWFDETWSGKLYYIKRDDITIRADIKRCEENKDNLTI